METILSDLAKNGILASDEESAKKTTQAALTLLSGGSVGKLPEKEAQATSLVAALLVDATRHKYSLEDFHSSCGDFFSGKQAFAATSLKSAYETARNPSSSPLSQLHSSFYADLPHLVGVSSTVQHHVRDFSIRLNPSSSSSSSADQQQQQQSHNQSQDEKQRSVANFVFALDVVQRPVFSSSNSNHVAEGEESQIAFQCTGEQAQELANSLRQAAASLQKAEARLQK